MFLSLFRVSPQAINVTSQTEERKTIKVARNFSSFILFLEQKWAIWDATLSHLHRYFKCDSPSSWVSRLGVIELRSWTLGSFTVEGLEVASQQWGVCVCVGCTYANFEESKYRDVIWDCCGKMLEGNNVFTNVCSTLFCIHCHDFNSKSKIKSVICDSCCILFLSLHARLFACMWRTSDRTAPTLAHTLQNSTFCRWGTTIAWVIYGRYFHLVQSFKRMVTGNRTLILLWSEVSLIHEDLG